MADKETEIEAQIEKAVAKALGAMTENRPEFTHGEILKVNAEERIVWGWANISTVNGELIVDKQGDVIRPEELRKAASRFMEMHRTGKAMHEGGQIGEVIHSLPLTKELGSLLGVYSNVEGWIVAMKIHDDAIWKRVQSGELKAFSVGGRSKKKDYDNA